VEEIFLNEGDTELLNLFGHRIEWLVQA